MKIGNKEIKFKALVALMIYYCVAYYLPNSYSFVLGKISNSFRIWLCHFIFKKCGDVKTINRKVNFGSGRLIEIGNNSGIGANTTIPSNTIIGENVMLSRNCFILNRNHQFMSTDLPIKAQGFKPVLQTIIEDDVWIGMRSLLTPGRHIIRGTIVAMGSVLTKDFPEYSIVGGNPAKLIKNRKEHNG